MKIIRRRHDQGLRLVEVTWIMFTTECLENTDAGRRRHQTVGSDGAAATRLLAALLLRRIEALHQPIENPARRLFSLRRL